MCRIFGQFGNRQINERLLQESALSMIHGGPDQQNYVIGRGWAIGNDRLSIQGINGGIQPFIEIKDISVVFNGEIYNHHQLRKFLVSRGYTFQDNCDGNVIAPLFELYGEDFVKHLDGMFAIAIIDERKCADLHIYTDPAGIKSVYYSESDDQTIIFASEIDGLRALANEPLVVNSNAVLDYLSLRAICGEATIFNGIKTLGPSRHLKCILGGNPRVSTYSTFIQAPDPGKSLSEAGLQLRNLLNVEIKSMLDADVPVCVVTSGGLDSTLISAIAAQHVENLHSFHVCYKGIWPSDERAFAQEAAKKFGTIHNEIEINPDDFPEIIQRMIKHLGQPNTAPHCLSTYSLFEGIKNAGFKVSLTGEGADELFGGYERFGAALRTENDWIADYLDKFGPFKGSLRREVLTQNFYDVANGVSSRISEFTARIEKTKPGIDRLNTLQGLDQWDRFPYYILRRADHLSMAHAVEVRIPFCQPKILDFARKLPIEHRLSDGKSKRVVYEAASDLVPQSILDRKKQPFTLPVVAMIKKGEKLFDYMESVFLGQDFVNRGYFNSNKISDLLALQAREPSADLANMLWSVMIFELWHRNVDDMNSSMEYNKASYMHQAQLTLDP